MNEIGLKCILFLISFYFMGNLTFVKAVSGTIAKLQGLDQDESLMEYADLRGIKQTKYNKTTMVLSGNFTFFKPFVQAKVSISIFKKLSNGYMPMPMVDIRNQDYCALFKNPQWQEYIQEDLFNHTNLPKGCNYYPGKYTLFNYQPPVPDNLPVGEYRAEISFTIDDKLCLKYRGHATVLAPAINTYCSLCN